MCRAPGCAPPSVLGCSPIPPPTTPAPCSGWRAHGTLGTLGKRGEGGGHTASAVVSNTACAHTNGEWHRLSTAHSALLTHLPRGLEGADLAVEPHGAVVRVRVHAPGSYTRRTNSKGAGEGGRARRLLLRTGQACPTPLGIHQRATRHRNTLRHAPTTHRRSTFFVFTLLSSLSTFIALTSGKDRRSRSRGRVASGSGDPHPIMAFSSPLELSLWVPNPAATRRHSRIHSMKESPYWGVN